MKRFDIYLIELEPVRGREIAKTRPGLIVSPDELNARFGTIVIVPLTSTHRHGPSRVSCTFSGHPGELALDQIRSVDKSRCLRRLGRLDEPTARTIADRLVAMFMW